MLYTRTHTFYDRNRLTREKKKNQSCPTQQTSKSSRLLRKKKRTTNLLINQNYIQLNKNSNSPLNNTPNANGLNRPIKRHRLTGLESKIHLSVVFKKHHQQRHYEENHEITRENEWNWKSLC